MNRQTILSELKKLIATFLTDDEVAKLDTLTETTSLLDDLKIDSVDLVDIVIQIETQFGIQIENETIPKMDTVGKCLDVIEEKLKVKG